MNFKSASNIRKYCIRDMIATPPVAVGILSGNHNELYSRPHYHDFYEMEFVLDGKYEQNVNGKSCQCPAGTLYLLSPTDVHSYITNNGAEYRLCCIQFASSFLSGDVYRTLLAQKGFLLADTAEYRDIVRELCMCLNSESEAMCPDRMMMMRVCIERICLIMFRCAGQCLTPPPSSDKVSETEAYIGKNIYKKLTAEKIAGELGISPNYLGQLFLAKNKITISGYIRRKRLDIALNLIRNSDYTLEAIAFETGFSSYSNFAYEFKKYYGKSAGAYRKE